MPFQPRPGTYALLLSAATEVTVRVGRLGELRVQPGFYIYVGSAFGPGGVRARLAHHLRPANRPHWHIDYLRFQARIEGVWFCYHRQSLEHEWARGLARLRRASMPLAGFGSSDCDCQSHLFFFRNRPARLGLSKGLKTILFS